MISAWRYAQAVYALQGLPGVDEEAAIEILKVGVPGFPPLWPACLWRELLARLQVSVVR